MSVHSYSRCWLHLIWSTLNREPLLTEAASARVNNYLAAYAEENGFYLKISYVNPDHVHALVDLPTSCSIEKLTQLLKGSSSHWVNEQRLTMGRFAWGRGYGVFSVSESHVPTVARYIANQEEHHRKRTFIEEYRTFVDRYGLTWRDAMRSP